MIAPMALYRNAASQRLVFAGITNPATGRTLVLDAGEEVDLDHDPDQPNLVAADKAAGAEVAARVKKLKGDEVDAELEAAGLATDGKVDDRKARLVKHLTGTGT